jgi:hypothetical protein
MSDPGCRAATCGELKAVGDKGERRDASEDVRISTLLARTRFCLQNLVPTSTAGRARFLKFFSKKVESFSSRFSPFRRGADASRPPIATAKKTPRALSSPHR